MHTTGLALNVLLALFGASTAVPDVTAQAPLLNWRFDNPLLPPFMPPPAVLMTQKRQNVDNTCGKQNGKDVKCGSNSLGGGPCCSQWNFCGAGPLYCGEGCQSEFGECDASVSTTRQRHCGPKHKNRKCSPGECCSEHGKCGRSEKFCGTHCQPEFGVCHPQDEPKRPTPTGTQPASGDHQKRCGKDFENTQCTGGECCSAAGYCGKGNDYCSVPQNCQRKFGRCDSDAIPKGFDLSPMSQPRTRFGKVPYNQVISKCTKPRTIALTFDDGPSNNTERLLDVLRDHGVKATFFLSGNTNGKGMIDQTELWIKVIKRMVKEGHQVGSHTWSHPHLDKMSRNDRLTDMFRNDRAIANIIGKFPTYMRAPYTACTSGSQCTKDMADIGYHVAGWDVDSHDWEPKTTIDQMKQTINKIFMERKADDNMFLIQHDHNQHSVELTKHVLEQAKQKNWQAVTLGQCLGDPAEFWYRDPIWIDFSSVASTEHELGCIVSEKQYCGQFTIQNKLQPCLDKQFIKCKSSLKQCHKQLGHAHPACSKYQRFCDKHKSFCKRCGKKNQPRCDLSKWSFNSLQG